MEWVLIQGLRQFYYSSIISPLLLIWVYPCFGTFLKLLVMVARQLCALVPSLWRCSQSTDREQAFFPLWVKKQASCRVLFKLMHILPTYFQFSVFQCFPFCAGHAGSCADTHNISNELLTFCLGPVDGGSQKIHQTCHSYPWGEPGCLGLRFPLSQKIYWPFLSC